MGESKRDTEVLICAHRPDRQNNSQENITDFFEAGLRNGLHAAE